VGRNKRGREATSSFSVKGFSELQNEERVMLRVGSLAPDFSLNGVHRGKVGEYRLRDFRGRWLVLFFYPRDFTFICPTEVVGFSERVEEFRACQAEIVGVSVDPVESHKAWAEELGGVDYPLLSDESREMVQRYNVLDGAEGVALRATFIITPQGEVAYCVVSHMNVGRSVAETLRVVRALQTQKLCPADWQPGQETADLSLKY
jgi:alkyl hydroperoxide reductase subunit AhpC